MKSGTEKDVKAAIDAGANVNASNASGRVLHSAAHYGRKDLVQLLLDAGADPEGANQHGETALHFAVKQNRTSVINLLLETTPQLLNARTKVGVTPLMEAATLVEAKLVKLLLSRGADHAERTREGKTALTMAAKVHQPPRFDATEVLRLLLEAGAEVPAQMPSRAKKVVTEVQAELGLLKI